MTTCVQIIHNISSSKKFQKQRQQQRKTFSLSFTTALLLLFLVHQHCMSKFSFAFTFTTTIKTFPSLPFNHLKNPTRTVSTTSHPFSSLQMSSSQQQEKTSIAILGGGIAGLSCAHHLSALSPSPLSVTVFDTGRLRPGGRCSSRFPHDKPKEKGKNQDSILSNFVIDHAAQIITVPNNSNNNNIGDDFKEFERQVKEWEENGIVKRFPKGSVVAIQKNKKDDFQIVPINGDDDDDGSNKDDLPIMYHATNGMGSIPQTLASTSSFQLHQDVWISPSNGVKYASNSWNIKSSQKKYGAYTHLIIAHNGKCADRIMSRTPAKELHSLLRTNFAPSVSAAGGKRMTLNSIYSLTFALSKKSSVLGKTLAQNIQTCLIQNEPNLKCLSCQTRKYPSSVKDDVEVWTLLSSAKFGKKYKGPQENLPNELVEEVTGLLLQSLERSLGLEEKSLWDGEKKNGGGVVLDSKLQLWGAAVPLNTWSVDNDETDEEDAKMKKSGFLYDAKHKVGACGDWLLHPSIGGAWESGRRLADWIVHDLEDEKKKKKKEGNCSSVGLPPHGKFVRSDAALEAGIASFK